MTSTKTGPASRDVTAELVFLTRALKAPTLRDAVPRLAAVPGPRDAEVEQRDLSVYDRLSGGQGVA